MDDRCMKTRLLILIALCLSAGCAQTQFHASELPAKYAARPTVDYSRIDLTSLATISVKNDTIQSGDRIQVNLNTGASGENSDLTWKVSVDESGQTSLPNIGPVRLAGMTRAEAEKSIVQASLQRDVFLTPVVEVSLEKRPDRIIYVSGAVKNPGPVKVSGTTASLADAIARAGGLTSDASGTIALSNASNGGNSSPTMQSNEVIPIGQQGTGYYPAKTVSLSSTSPQQLAEIIVPEGALIHVEKVEPRPIQVVGVIKNQVVEVPSGKDVNLLDAVTMAGGQTYSNWISDKVTITRHVSDGNGTIRIRGSIRKARADSSENIPLAPYDIVTVEENILTFTLSTLSGLFGAGVSAARITGP
jgi:polysaccharide biosynthesis/export protein